MTMEPEDPIKLTTPLPAIRPNGSRMGYVSFTGLDAFYFHEAKTLEASALRLKIPFSFACSGGWHDAENIARLICAHKLNSYRDGMASAN